MKRNSSKRNQLEGNINEVRKRIFSNKATFHKEQALLSFPEKIKILIKLQILARNIKHSDHPSWQI